MAVNIIDRKIFVTKLLVLLDFRAQCILNRCEKQSKTTETFGFQLFC